MILAAGLGSRLKDFTSNTPKCLLKAGGLTMLEHTIALLKKAGVTEVVINLYYRGDQIKNFLTQNDPGLKVHYSQERELLGTGGGLKYAQHYLDTGESFFLFNSDIYTDLDVRALYKAHHDSGALATLAVMERETSRYLLFESSSGALVGWENPQENKKRYITSSESNIIKLAFSGLQVISPRIFKYMDKPEASYSVITSYLAACKAGELVNHFRMDQNIWLDMGTPERFEELNKLLSKDLVGF